MVDDYRSGSSTSATTTGRVGPTESPIRAFSSASGRPAGDRRADRTPRFGGSTTDTRSLGSTATGFSRRASSPRIGDRDEWRTGSGRVSVTDRRSASRPPARQSDRRSSELVVERHSTAGANSGTVTDEMGAPEPNRRARVSSPLRSDANPSSLRTPAATHAAVGWARDRSGIGDSTDRHAADVVRAEWSRPSDTTPVPSSATAVRAGSDGSARAGTVPSWTDTRSSDPTRYSAAAGPSRHDDSGSLRAPTRIDSLRSVAATGPTRGVTDPDVAPSPEREPTEPRGAASLNSRGPRLAVMGRERSHRSQQGTEAAARSEPIAGPVRSSRRDPVTAGSPGTISQRRGSGMGTVTQRGGSEGETLAQMGGSRTGTVSLTRVDDGERGTRSFDRDRSSAAPGATTATPVTVSNSDTPSAPSHSISRSQQPSAADTEPAAASPDPNPTALGTAVASSSHRFDSGTPRDRADATLPDSSGRMPVLRLRSDRGPSPGRGDRTVRTVHSSPDSSRTRRVRERTTGDSSFPDSGPVGTTIHSAADAASASTDTLPAGGSVSAQGPTARSVARSTDISARVRETPSRTTTHTHSTNTVVSPSGVSANPRGSTRSDPLTSAVGSQFGAEFGSSRQRFSIDRPR